MHIIIKPKAKDDLENIFKYSVENFGFKIAENYLLTIEAKFQTIKKNHKIGKRNTLLGFKIKSIKSKSHLIFFKVIDSNTVEIVRILHQSMNYKDHL